LLIVRHLWLHGQEDLINAEVAVLAGMTTVKFAEVLSEPKSKTAIDLFALLLL